MNYKQILKISEECRDIEKFIDELDKMTTGLSSTKYPSIKLIIDSNICTQVSFNTDDKNDITKMMSVIMSTLKLNLKYKTEELKKLLNDE